MDVHPCARLGNVILAPGGGKSVVLFNLQPSTLEILILCTTSEALFLSLARADLGVKNLNLLKKYFL